MSAELFTSHASREIASSTKHDVYAWKFREEIQGIERGGGGIHFPRRPLTKAVAERHVRYKSSVLYKTAFKISNQVRHKPVCITGNTRQSA